jgi:drug/metabolite transporter (DMT)-like permease
MATGMVILGIMLARRGKNWYRSFELKAGFLNGVLLTGIGITTLTALHYHGPAIVFPFTVAGPVVLVLLLGKYFYHEHLDRFAWLACILAFTGLLALSL